MLGEASRNFSGSGRSREETLPDSGVRQSGGRSSGEPRRGVVATFEERFDKLELRGGERPGLGGR